MAGKHDVPDLVQAYENGLYTSGELFTKVLELSDSISLDELTAGLPQALYEEFVDFARRHYDNDRPADAFKNLHSMGHMPTERLANLRDWLSRQSNPHPNRPFR